MKTFRPYLILFLIFIVSCHAEDKLRVPPAVAAILRNPKANKNEIEFFIRHYNKNPADSLKLKACYFLLSNLDDRYYYQGQLLDDYRQYLKLIRKDQDHGAYYLRSFEQLYGQFSYDLLEKKMDIETFQAEEWIQDLDLSFSLWKNSPWNKQLKFEDFCEYLLPFHLDDEKPEFNRPEIYKNFLPLVAPVIKAKGGAVEATTAVNNILMNPKWILTQRVSFLPHFGPKELMSYKAGSCRDMADLAVYCLRSIGVPVCEDFVPQWPYRSMGHDWNVIFNISGRPITFLGAEDNPGSLHKPGTKKGKVYRRTFSKNIESLAMQSDRDQEVPDLFNDSRIKDVTSSYVRTFDIMVQLQNPSSKPRKNVYLALFNDYNWIPVSWSRIDGNQSTFRSVEGDIIYLPVYYTDENVQPAAWPVLLSKTGEQTSLKPHFDKQIKNITLERTYPIIPDLFWVQNLVGGVFQGSNDPQFKNAITLDSIKAKPLPFSNEISLNTKKTYRYYRYRSSNGGHVNLGELEFYNMNRKLYGNPIGEKGAFNNSDRTFDKVFDGNIATFYDARNAAGGWVGMDFKNKVRVTKIRFSAAMDKPVGKIDDGHKYELFFWNNEKQWQSLGSAIAKSGRVEINNVPSNALFKLHDLSGASKERIFIYKKGRAQIWF